MNATHADTVKTGTVNALQSELFEIAAERAKNVFNHVTRRKLNNVLLPAKEILFIEAARARLPAGA